MRFFLAALAVVVFLVTQQRWHDTLIGDFRGVYYPLSAYFWSHGNLKDFVGVSIYPPGANLFFMLLPPASLEIFGVFLVAANSLFLGLLAKLTKRYILLGLVTLAAGPILLVRFDLLVMLLVVAAILTFQKNKLVLSGLLLGLATITKLFPVVLLPYFLFVLFFHNRQKIWPYIIAFCTSIAVIFSIYLLLSGLDPWQIIKVSSGAFAVSVHVESVMATFLTLGTMVTNPGPHGLVFREALWSLDPLYFFGHASLFRYFSPIIISLSYLIIFIRDREFKISSCLLIILSLLVSSQLLSPQYIIWPAMLVLLWAKPDKIIIALILLALFLTQLIYPLNYGEFLDFYTKGLNLWLFLVMTTRNLALVLLTLKLFREEIVKVN